METVTTNQHFCIPLTIQEEFQIIKEVKVYSDLCRCGLELSMQSRSMSYLTDLCIVNSYFFVLPQIIHLFLSFMG